MKLFLRVLVFAALLGAGVWLWLHFYPSPEEAIRRQLNELAETASYEGSEGMVATLAAANKFGSFFALEVRMNIEPPGFFEEESTRKDITQFVGAVRARGGIRSLKVKFFDPVITLASNKESAIVEVTVNAETTGDRHMFVQELKLTMQRIEKKWLIARVETVKTLN